VICSNKKKTEHRGHELKVYSLFLGKKQIFSYIREPFLKCYFSPHLENNSEIDLREYFATKKMYNTEENPLILASSVIKNIY
jgi:hypothetical protein